VPFCALCVAAVNDGTLDRVANIQWLVIATLKFKERCHSSHCPELGSALTVGLLLLPSRRKEGQTGQTSALAQLVTLITAWALKFLAGQQRAVQEGVASSPLSFYLATTSQLKRLQT
jgi:hypothetical protein